MKKTLLIDVVGALHSEEHQEFLNFLKSPFCLAGNQLKDLETLFEVIISQYPDFPEAALEKSLVYEQVFKGKSFVEGKLEKLMVELNRHIRTYAIISRFLSPENEDQQQMEWIRWLRERKVDDRFHQAVSKFRKDNLTATDSYSILKYKNLFQIAEEEHTWEQSNNKLTGNLKIPELIDQLDLFYVNVKVEFCNRMLIQQKAARISPSDAHLFGFPDLEEMKQSSALFEFALGINSLLSKDTYRVEDFYALMTSMQSNESKLSAATIQHFYTYLRNYCTILIDEGHTEIIPVLHDLHKTCLDKGQLYVDNKIHSSAYLNLVQIAIRAKEINWAFEFTETHKTRLFDQDDQQVYYHLNLASCLLASGQFQQAIDNIPELPSSSFYHLMARRLELKAYYGLRSDLLTYKIDAFRKYVERTAPKSVADSIQVMNLNFANMLTQLSQSPAKDVKRSQRLLERIKSKKLICERSWLIEKAEDLG